MNMDQRSRIAILGFGLEGRAVLEYLQRHNYHDITVCDRDIALEQEMPDGVSVRLGEHYLDNLRDFEVIFRSPGIRVMEPQIQSAKALGVEVTSATGFFMDQCPCRIVGVTGTKGKGTTATLLYKMLDAGGVKAFLGGNIGMPAISFLDELGKDDIVVLELSSFQLQDLAKSPRYAVLLNTTEDHLDYHVDRTEYMQAKEHLLTHQSEEGVAVLNRDYEYSTYYTPLVKGALRLVSVRGEVSEGAFVEEGAIWHARGGRAHEVVAVAEVALRGSHNLENVMPAVVIARELGVPFEAIREVIRGFRGLPHRLEPVGEVRGVAFYNDSYSTTPMTSVAAVDSFDEPMVLIAGGSDKGADYHDWAQRILTKENLHAVVLIGDIAERMAEAVAEAEKRLAEGEGSPTEVVMADDLEEAVREALARSDDGGVVVMSPAAASFGLFKNYKERGERFREIVRRFKAS